MHSVPRTTASYIPTHPPSLSPTPSPPPAIPVHPTLTLPHLDLKRLDPVHLPPAHPRHAPAALTLAQADAVVQGALLVVVLPLETVRVGVAGLGAGVGRLRGGALDGAELRPRAAVVGAVRVLGRGGRIGEVVGEIGPVGAGGEQGGLDEVGEDVHEEEGGLWGRGGWVSFGGGGGGG